MGEAAEDLISGRCNPDGTWADWYIRDKDESQEKRKSNLEWSTQFLIDKGVQFQSCNGGIHLKVGEYDFYPSTGLYINRKTRKKGRGVKNFYHLISQKGL